MMMNVRSLLTSLIRALQYSTVVSGNSSAVEHNLAKVGVASSNLVSRSNYLPRFLAEAFFCGVTSQKKFEAGWQSGYAAACKAVDAGSIPTPASTAFYPVCPGGGNGRRKGLKIPRE